MGSQKSFQKGLGVEYGKQEATKAFRRVLTWSKANRKPQKFSKGSCRGVKQIGSHRSFRRVLAWSKANRRSQKFSKGSWRRVKQNGSHKSFRKGLAVE